MSFRVVRRFARGYLVFFRLKRASNRRFERCFGAVFGFLETIEFGGAEIGGLRGVCKGEFDYLRVWRVCRLVF